MSNKKLVFIQKIRVWYKMVVLLLRSNSFLNNRRLPRLVRYLLKIICLPWAVFLVLNGYIALPYLELVVTTKCNLLCKDCASLISYSRRQVDYNAVQLISDLSLLLRVVRKIRTLAIIGGEPFLYKDLSLLIKEVMSFESVDALWIVTNGTIALSKELIVFLQDPKITIVISDYGFNANSKNNLVADLQKHNICYQIRDFNNQWIDYGNVHKRGQPIHILKKLYKSCQGICYELFNGEFHMCARSAHASNLFRSCRDDSNQVYVRNKSKNLLRKEIQQLFSAEYLPICDFCSGNNISSKTVKPARQLCDAD